MKNNKRKLSCACLHYWRCQKSSCGCNSSQTGNEETSYNLIKEGNNITVVKGIDAISITFTEDEWEYSATIQYNTWGEKEIKNASELYEEISEETNAETIWNVLFSLV